MAQRHARASTSSPAPADDSFETTLAAASTAIHLQRKRARSQLGSSSKRGKKSSLGESLIRIVSAVTATEEPVSRGEREVVSWTRDAITRFAEARVERARVGQGGLSRLPPEVAVDALLLIERLAGMLE